MKIYMFRTVSLSIIRSSVTVHSAMVYVIQVCRQLASRIRMELVLLCCCWEFHSKNKFVKLVHLVGLIITKLVTMHGHINVKFFTKINYLCFQTIPLCSVFAPYFRSRPSPIQFSPLTNAEHNKYSTQPSLNYCMWCKTSE